MATLEIEVVDRDVRSKPVLLKLSLSHEDAAAVKAAARLSNTTVQRYLYARVFGKSLRVRGIDLAIYTLSRIGSKLRHEHNLIDLVEEIAESIETLSSAERQSSAGN